MSFEIIFKNEEDDTILIVGPNINALNNLKDISKEELMNSIKTQIKDLKYHFKYDKWELDADTIMSDIMYDILGFHFKDETLAYINSQLGTVTKYSNGGSFLDLPDTFVFYNNKTNKIVTSKKFKKKLEFLGTL